MIAHFSYGLRLKGVDQDKEIVALEQVLEAEFDEGMNPTAAILCIKFAACLDIKEAMAEAGVDDIRLAKLALTSEWGQDIIKMEYRKRIERLRTDGDRLLVEALDLKKLCEEKNQLDTALACLRFAGSLVGVIEGTTTVNGVQIVFGTENVARPSELNREAAAIPGRIDVSGNLQPGLLRAPRVPVHQDAKGVVRGSGVRGEELLPPDSDPGNQRDILPPGN